MIDQIETLVFYFRVKCPNCHDSIKLSHVVIKERDGKIFCPLCGKDMIIPDHEKLFEAAQTINNYICDPINASVITIELNPAHKVSDAAPAVH